jgi:cytochrome c-type biogenesis protein CcmE
VKTQHKVLVALALITGTAVWALAGSTGAAPFLDVHHITQDPDTYKADEFSVKGVVVANTTTTENQVIRFTLRDASGDTRHAAENLTVVYQGVLPDAFGPKMVVVTGTLLATGEGLVIQASEIQVGCSSKY